MAHNDSMRVYTCEEFSLAREWLDAHRDTPPKNSEGDLVICRDELGDLINEGDVRNIPEETLADMDSLHNDMTANEANFAYMMGS